MPDLRESLQWVRLGADLFARALSAQGDDHLAGPSRRPDRTGAEIVAQVTERLSAFAQAFGAEAPSFRGTGADVSSSAGDVLRQQYAESAATLVALLADRPSRADWTDTVTIDGTDERSAAAMWSLARELTVSAVDLGDEVGFGDLPADFLGALVEDITRHRATDGSPALEVLAQDTGEAWRLDGLGDPLRVMAPLDDLAAWLSGRSRTSVKVLGPGELPELSRWP